MVRVQRVHNDNGKIVQVNNGVSQQWRRRMIEKGEGQGSQKKTLFVKHHEEQIKYFYKYNMCSEHV
jgi:hypothetical protein